MPLRVTVAPEAVGQVDGALGIPGFFDTKREWHGQRSESYRGVGSVFL